MRTVLVTGASTGFGRNAVLDLAQAGWRVFASMRDPARAGTLIADAGANGERISILPLDVTDPVSVDRAVAEATEQGGGGIDVLLNNAGYGLMGAFEDLSDADCRRQMETNFFGTLNVTRAVLPTMRARERGRVVVITSNACNAPHPLLSLYAASKWALEGWAEGLAMEIAPFGLDVVVVQPGAHRTPFASNVMPQMPHDSTYQRWLEQATPGIGMLDAWGREPDAAREAIVAAVSAPGHPFRTALGEDTVAFAALKGALPYEARAAALRAIVGLPAPGAFTTKGPEGIAPPNPLATRLAQVLRDDPALLTEALRLLAPAATATH